MAPESVLAAVRAPHIVLVGPTAIGKSALAMEVARRQPEFEIVSIDSMQVYRGMDIGTAKPSPAEQAEVPHHLVDILETNEELALGPFVDQARRVLSDIEARGRRALVVGGTGLYVQTLVDELEVPPQFPAVRGELAEVEAAELFRRLTELDPTTAAKTDPNNRRRMERALEVTVGAGRPFSSFGPGLDRFVPNPAFRLLGVWLPREENGRRIDARVDAMVEAGWLDEVDRLRSSPRGLSRTAAKALGYQQLLDHLDGRLALADAVTDIKARTRAFSRRQRVWFRRDQRIRWRGTARDPGRLLDVLLRDCSVPEVRGGEAQ